MPCDLQIFKFIITSALCFMMVDGHSQMQGQATNTLSHPRPFILGMPPTLKLYLVLFACLSGYINLFRFNHFKINIFYHYTKLWATFKTRFAISNNCTTLGSQMTFE
jgi:hypothetical protein